MLPCGEKNSEEINFVHIYGQVTDFVVPFPWKLILKSRLPPTDGTIQPRLFTPSQVMIKSPTLVFYEETCQRFVLNSFSLTETQRQCLIYPCLSNWSFIKASKTSLTWSFQGMDDFPLAGKSIYHLILYNFTTKTDRQQHNEFQSGHKFYFMYISHISPSSVFCVYFWTAW